MIDIHCHLEQTDYNKDRNKIIESCKKQLNAVITCCAHPRDFDMTMKLIEKYPDFIFATIGIHPEYIKEISEKEVDEFFDLIRKNKDRIVGIGETGLDYWWIKEKSYQEKQKELFRKFIDLARELKKPLIVHAREAYDDVINVLEENDAERVVMHMFGAHHLLKKVLDNNWFVSLNTIVLRSKKHKKVARDTPFKNLLTETDSPWLDPNGGRNTPLNVKLVIEKIAEIKKIPFNKVDHTTTQNAIRVFSLMV
jgi:TatD DNase family protein